MPAPNSDFSEIVTATIDRYSPQLADNVLDNNALLSRLKRKGNTKAVGGGVKILENLMYAENSTAKWYSGLEVLDVSGSDVLTTASFDWKQLNTNVVISGLEQLQNAGREAKHNLIRARISVAEKTMQNKVADALFYSNTENSGKSIGGLQHLIADDPTSGIVGGIDRATATNAWWRNQVFSFAVETPSADVAGMKVAMNTIAMRTQRGTDMVDLFVGDETYFQLYLDGLQANQRFMSDEMASLGFRALKFWGGMADVLYDPNAPSAHMYGLNTDYIHFRPHSSRNFVTDPRKMSINQDAIVTPLYWAGNMTLSNASLQGVITA